MFRVIISGMFLLVGATVFSLPTPEELACSEKAIDTLAFQPVSPSDIDKTVVELLENNDEVTVCLTGPSRQVPIDSIRYVAEVYLREREDLPQQEQGVLGAIMQNRVVLFRERRAVLSEWRFSRDFAIQAPKITFSAQDTTPRTITETVARQVFSVRDLSEVSIHTGPSVDDSRR